MVTATERLPEASSTEVSQPNRPVPAAIDLDTLLPLLGFNDTRTIDDCGTIVDIQFAGRQHLFLANHRFGEGRVIDWTTSASPHRAIDCAKWP